MISQILEQVKSPFTDELIKDLIEKYITCNCNDDLFYYKINKLQNADKSTSKHISALMN